MCNCLPGQTKSRALLLLAGKETTATNMPTATWRRMNGSDVMLTNDRSIRNIGRCQTLSDTLFCSEKHQSNKISTNRRRNTARRWCGLTDNDTTRFMIHSNNRLMTRNATKLLCLNDPQLANQRPKDDGKATSRGVTLVDILLNIDILSAPLKRKGNDSCVQ